MIKHVLKDGREVDSIKGQVIKIKDFEHLYEVIDRIEQKADKTREG